jgi:FKBP-type peptidyl-prolyl cis-trans isomerase SlyD
MTDSLTVEKDRVVAFHYVLTDEQGEELGSSRGEEPLAALVGHGNVMPGLESALVGRTTGDKFEVTLPPDQAFGERREDWVQRVSKKYVRQASRLRPGMQTELQTNEGLRTVTVVKVGSSVLDVDLNHPLAGRTVRFAVEIIDVREASAEERAHGHAHGAGGHHH